jgi:hypothetical protein
MIYAISSMIDGVVASAGEAEYGAAFIWIRTIAIANEFAIGLGNDTIKQKRAKSIDIRFHSLRDRIRQGRPTLLYLTGKQNLTITRLRVAPAKKFSAV